VILGEGGNFGLGYPPETASVPFTKSDPALPALSSTLSIYHQVRSHTLKAIAINTYDFSHVARTDQNSKSLPLVARTFEQ